MIKYEKTTGLYIINYKQLEIVCYTLEDAKKTLQKLKKPLN